MKVLPLPCKKLDLRVARMTTKNGDPVSSRRLKNSVRHLNKGVFLYGNNFSFSCK